MNLPINPKAIPKFVLYFGATVCVISFLIDIMSLIKQNATDQIEMLTAGAGCALLIVFVVFKIMMEPLNEITKKEK